MNCVPLKTILSIVNHNNDNQIADFLISLEKHIEELSNDNIDLQIVVTNNTSSDFDFSNVSCQKTDIINNLYPRGFGANHNTAFQTYQSDVFIIANPDINIISGQLFTMVTKAYEQKSLISPLLQEDNINFFPGRQRASISTLLYRFYKLFIQNYLHIQEGYCDTDYDWVVGVFFVICSTSFRRVNGFDESLFMYYEDADLCRRLRLNDVDLMIDENMLIKHYVGRGSKKGFMLLWHHIKNAIKVNFFSKWKR